MNEYLSFVYLSTILHKAYYLVKHQISSIHPLLKLHLSVNCLDSKVQNISQLLIVHLF